MRKDIPASGTATLKDLVGRRESFAIASCVGPLFVDTGSPVEYERTRRRTKIRLKGKRSKINPDFAYGPDIEIVVDNKTGTICPPDCVPPVSDRELMEMALPEMGEPDDGEMWIPARVRFVSCLAWVSFWPGDETGKRIPDRAGFAVWIDLRTGKEFKIPVGRRKPETSSSAGSPAPT